MPAARLARLHKVPGSYRAEQLQALSRAGLVTAVQGKAGGHALTRPPERITVLDAVTALDGARPAFTCTEIRRREPPAAAPDRCVRPCAITRATAAAEAAWRAALREVSIAGLAQDMTEDYGPGALDRVGAWPAAGYDGGPAGGR